MNLASFLLLRDEEDGEIGDDDLEGGEQRYSCLPWSGAKRAANKTAQHGAGMIKIRNRKTTEAVWISRNVENAQKC